MREIEVIRIHSPTPNFNIEITLLENWASNLMFLMLTDGHLETKHYLLGKQ